jgi:hypothetical protein
MGISVRIKVKIPEEVFNRQAVVERIIAAQRTKTAPALESYFRKTTEGWQTPPEWSRRQTVTSHSIAMAVFASGPHADQYKLVNNGASPHSIRPRQQGGMLRFQPGYHAATKPHVLSSNAFSRFGNFISSMGVEHPGFEAREFDLAVAEAHFDDFARDMQDAMKP